MTTILIVAVLVLAAGGVFKVLLDRSGSEFQITGTEFVVGALICAVCVIPLTWWVGASIARSSNETFKEFWNGYETQAIFERTACHRDGACVHTYDCDPWTTTYTTTDSKGNVTVHTQTHYHQCPYTDEEWTFTVDTTLGPFVIGDHVLPTNPYQHYWRRPGFFSGGDHIPHSLADHAGVPSVWLAAKRRLDRGDHGPVTAIHDYTNYILAAQHTIEKQYSGSIDGYLKRGLLPKVVSQVHDFYLADKAYFVGVAPHNASAWEDAVNRFDAAFGTDRQGDLHLLIVNAKQIEDPNDWFGALQAYWQSSKLGKHAISKNGLIVAVGTRDGKTVAWARAATGMPLGNELLLQDLESDLQGAPLNAETLLGVPTVRFVNQRQANGKQKVVAQVVHSQGIVERDVWGPHGFHRVHMKCQKKQDHCVGFGYLSGDVQPTTGQKTLIGFMAFFFSFLVWAALAAVQLPFGPGSSTNRPAFAVSNPFGSSRYRSRF